MQRSIRFVLLLSAAFFSSLAMLASSPTGTIPKPPPSSGNAVDFSPTGTIPKPPPSNGNVADFSPTGTIPKPPPSSGNVVPSSLTSAKV